MDAILKTMDGFPLWIQAVLAIVALCKVITFWTPTKVTPLVNGLMRGLNIGALNILLDKNKDDKVKK